MHRAKPFLAGASGTAALLLLLPVVSAPRPGEPLALRWLRKAAEHPLRTGLAAGALVLAVAGAGPPSDTPAPTGRPARGAPGPLEPDRDRGRPDGLEGAPHASLNPSPAPGTPLQAGERPSGGLEWRVRISATESPGRGVAHSPGGPPHRSPARSPPLP